MSDEKQWEAEHARPQGHRGRRTGLFTGVALILVGFLFLLDNLYVLDLRFAWESWPLILVLFGVIRMLERSDRSSGLWLVFIGLWLFMNETELWGFSYRESWPLVVVFVGVSMVWKALRAHAQPPASGGMR